ncbi:hypothetical protein [Oceanobacillus sp. CAU 1775]
MNKHQKATIYVAVVVFVFFFVLSLVTQQWGFLWWSLLAIFTALLPTYFKKVDKKNKTY